MTVAERYTELNTLAANIAKLLGPEWSADECDPQQWNWMTHLNQNGEQRIYINTAREPGKLYIAYSRPRDVYDDWTFKEACKEHTTDIKVSISKTPEQIVRDINRRLMPGIEVLEKVAAERRQAANTYQTTMTAMMNELHAALGQGRAATAEQQKNGHFDVVTNVYRGDTVDVAVHPQYDGEVNILLSRLPKAAALDVLAFLRNYQGQLHKEVERYG